MKKEECPICEYENEGEEVTSCPRCATPFTGSTMEKKVMGAHGTYSTKERPNLGCNAYVSLTDQRLVVVPMALTAAITNKLRSKYERTAGGKLSEDEA